MDSLRPNSAPQLVGAEVIRLASVRTFGKTWNLLHTRCHNVGKQKQQLAAVEAAVVKGLHCLWGLLASPQAVQPHRQVPALMEMEAHGLAGLALP